jgi:hypothetical protein
MFTTPDAADAAVSLPPIGAPGPHPNGFYLDCDPPSGKAGTVFEAAYFNELILNLRRLLTEAGRAAVKGDPLMLTDAIRLLIDIRRPIILSPLTLNVATTGSATPVNPIGGDPFNSIAAALNFLLPYRLEAEVRIAVAAGTYNITATLPTSHQNIDRVRIEGAGSTTTTLAFTGVSAIQAFRRCPNRIAGFTITGTGTVDGVYFSGPFRTAIGDVTIRGFGKRGLVLDGATICTFDATVKVENCTQEGILMSAASEIGGTFNVIVNNCGGLANLTLGAYCLVNVDAYVTDGGQRGLYIDGGSMMTRNLNITNSVQRTAAVTVTNGGLLTRAPASVAGDFAAFQGTPLLFDTFTATHYGLIKAAGVMNAGNVSTCSPAANTLGNTQAFIQTS